MGDLTKITAPDNTFLSYTYDDARRLISVTNAQGETQSYTLDAMGNRTSALLKDASGTLVRQQHRTYDELGRLLTLVRRIERNRALHARYGDKFDPWRDD